MIKKLARSLKDYWMPNWQQVQSVQYRVMRRAEATGTVYAITVGRAVLFRSGQRYFGLILYYHGKTEYVAKKELPKLFTEYGKDKK